MKNLSILIFIVSFAGLAQAPSIQWQKNFGGSNDDQASVIIQTSDGGYVIAGSTKSNDFDVAGLNHVEQEGNTSLDWYILRLDPDGNIIWKKTIGGTVGENVYDIIQTPGGNFAAVGYTDSIDGDSMPTSESMPGIPWLVILDASGNITFKKFILPPAENWVMGGCCAGKASKIKNTPDGGFVIASTGWFFNAFGYGDGMITKLNAAGAIEWQRIFGFGQQDELKSVEITSDGGYIIVGDATPNLENAITDYWIIKLNSTGQTDWEKVYGGTGSDEATDVKQTNDGNYLVSGYTSSNNGQVNGNHFDGRFDFWLMKLNLSGDIVWQHCYGGSGDEYAISMALTNDNGCIVTGQTRYGFDGGSPDGDVAFNHNSGTRDIWVAKISDNGAMEWQKSLGGGSFDDSSSIIKTFDGGYAIAGESASDDGDLIGNHGGFDFWVVKLSPETLSMNNSDLNSFSIYPNPVNNEIHIFNTDKLVIDAVSIYDVSGRIVKEEKGNLTQMNTTDIASGHYILKIQSGEKKYVNKFIKI